MKISKSIYLSLMVTLLFSTETFCQYSSFTPIYYPVTQDFNLNRQFSTNSNLFFFYNLSIINSLLLNSSKQKEEVSYYPVFEAELIENVSEINFPELDTFKSESYYSKGFLLYQQEKYTSALKQFESSFLFNPQNSQTIYMMGMCNLHVGNFYGACKCWNYLKNNGFHYVDKELFEYCR